MRPEDWEKYRDLARNMERLRPTVEQVKMYQDLARNAERMQPTPEQVESWRRQAEVIRKMLNDPALQQSHSQARQLFEQRNDVLAQMPNEATRKQLEEVARYLNSREFRSQRDAILQTNQLAQQRFGSEGLAAAGRVSARRTATDGSQQRGAERIRSGQAFSIIEEASELAASPEIRETIERADPEAVLRLDQEEREEALASEQIEIVDPSIGETDLFKFEVRTYTKEEWLEMHTQALIVLWTLEAAFGPLAVVPATTPIAAPIAGAIGGLIALLSITERVISRWED